MAKGQDAGALSEKIISDVRSGKFAPVYLLMGAEPFYPDRVCDAIVTCALSDDERDFNQSVFYGPQTESRAVASDAKCYPMMAERRLVVLKEAQNMKSLEDLALYCAEPVDTTVLVILMRGASADKRKSLYKTVSKTGIVLESPEVRDYEMTGWIDRYYRSLGLNIDPEAAELLFESAGADLGKIALETDKMLKNLPEEVDTIRVEDVEKNVGLSRQYTVFELNKALSYRDAPKAFRIAANLASAPKFFMPPAISALYMHFSRILKYEALLLKNPHPTAQQKTVALSVAPFFFREYDAAVSNYPLPKCMSVISLLEEFDYRGKGGDSSSATSDPAELMAELVARILS